MDLIKFREGVGNDKKRQTENLVDLIVRIALESTAPEIKTLVGHRWPDDDTLLCIWMAKKFIPKTKNATVMFINASTSLPGSEKDLSILHFDTGRGDYDQHGKKFRKTCSAVLLAEKLELLNDPGLKPLLELATKVDNIEPLSPTNIHYIIEGYPRMFKKDGSIDWQTVMDRTFELFDIIYNQETARVKARGSLERFSEWTTLPNGLKISSILWHPECREAAFEAEAAVVIWTVSRNKNHFYTGIQVNRRYRRLLLDNVVASLRDQEGKVRQIDIHGQDLRYIGREKPITNWYLHDSKRLILNGSRTWQPTEEEYTKLTPRQIVGLVHRALSPIPREIVSRWKR